MKEIKPIKRYKKIIRIAVIAMTALSIFLMCFFARFNLEKYAGTYSFNEGWYYYDADGNRVDVVLPTSVSLEGSDTLVLYNDNIEMEEEHLCLYTRAAAYKLEMYAGEELIYKFSDNGLKKNETIHNGITCIGRLPNIIDENCQLRFVYYSDSEKINIPEINIGEKDSILIESFCNNFYRLFIDTIILVIGIIGIAVYIVSLFSKKPTGNIIALGIYLILGSTWCFVDSSFILMLFNYSNFLYYINHLTFMTMTIPLIYYVMGLKNMERTGFLYTVEILSYLNVIVQSGLYLLGITDLFDLLTITHVLLFATVTGTVIMCISEYRRTWDKDILICLLSVGMLGVIGVGAIIFYLNGQFMVYQVLFQTGILIMIIILVVNLVLQYQKSIEQNVELKAYKNLADRDELTGLKNRRAFDYILSRIESREISFTNIILIYIDLNDLKKINDTLGHMTGDRAIKRVATCINKVFNNTEYAFRLGGDEFAVIVVNPDRHAEDYRKEFFERVNAENHEFIDDYEITAAFGFSHIYNGKNREYKPISIWKSEADSRMYEDKKRSKKSRSDRESE